VQGRNACGRTNHDVLEFGGSPTGPAAAYPAPLCEFIGTLLVAGASKTVSAADARRTAALVAEGRVTRHTLRGATEDGAREAKRAEDDRSLAGMRNPASTCKRWPDLVAAMRPVQEALLAWQQRHP
jgi:hypothetical protein